MTGYLHLQDVTRVQALRQGFEYAMRHRKAGTYTIHVEVVDVVERWTYVRVVAE